MNTLYLLRELWAALRRKRWSASRLAEYQLVRLRAMVRHAYEAVPYYHELFDNAGVRPTDIRSLADLSHLPITTKATLQGLAAEAILARGLDPRTLVMKRTSGSTGRPFTVRYTQRDRIRKSAIYIRTYLQAGLRLTDKQVCLTEERGQHGHRGWLQALEVLLTEERGQHRRRRWLQALGVGHRAYVSVLDSLDSQLDQLQRLQPDFLLGFPSALRQVAEAMETRSEPLIRPRVICTSAEVLDRDTRQVIESAFGLPVFDLYSSIEFGNIAWQCRYSGAMHINADSLIVEVVRPDGIEAAPGEIGRLVCTDFDSYAMPFIRYTVGDLGTLTNGSCECGCAFPILGSTLEGRTVDQIRRSDGVVISPHQFTESFECVQAIAQYQVTQETLEQLTVRLVPGRGFGPATTDEVLARCRAILGEGTAVTVQVVDSIPREPSGKFRVVKSKVWQAEARP
jgi:phenylacetate-CoA ligase